MSTHGSTQFVPTSVPMSLTRENGPKKFWRGHSLGNISRNSLRNPVWRDGAMTTTHSSMTQLSDRVERSAPEPEGSALLRRLADGGLSRAELASPPARPRGAPGSPGEKGSA